MTGIAKTRGNAAPGTRGIFRAMGTVPYPDKIPAVQNLRAVSFLAHESVCFGHGLMTRTLLVLLLASWTAACNPTGSRSVQMADLPKAAALKEQLAFTCAYEKDKLLPLDPELDQLFKRAVWIYKQNRLKNDPEEYAKAERLYRIAAAYGHYKAMNNLGEMLARGQSDADDAVELPFEMTQDMIRRGIPLGYFNMGILLDTGYGVKQDEKAALKYFRKAADLGNPYAQYLVGNKLTNLTIDYPVPYKIGLEMKRCAADQGHAEAAIDSAYNLQGKAEYSDNPAEATRFYADAVKYFQIAVKAGSSQAAYKLQKSFLGPLPDDRLDYLALEKDEERSRRYGVISKILDGCDYLGATVDEIDRIVPLPSAKLPPWDGQLEWMQRWNANVPPRIPDEERIAGLAKAKGLDPATGRPVQETP
ncbi:MAG: sel1 repeat family protein [Helicobacteraceae bacterium]|jgi:TPR repeat protein|nr:sel1 repeat family protein [Helicobacteraceae bacterium]